jgi:hypothetical protein
MGTDGQIHAPIALSPKKTPGTYCAGGWVGTRDGLNDYKISPPLVFDLGTVQSLAGRYSTIDHILQGISVLEGV